MDIVTDLIIPQDILELEDIPAIQKLILAFDRQYPKATNETIAHYIGISKRQLYKHRSKLKKVNCSSPYDDEKVNCSSPSNDEKVNCSSPYDSEKVNCSSPSDSEKVNCSSPYDDEKVNCSSPSNDEKVNCSSPSGDVGVLKTSPPDEINPYEWSWNFINDIKTVEEYRSKEKKIDKILTKKGVFTYDQLMTLIWMVDGKEKELKLK